MATDSDAAIASGLAAFSLLSTMCVLLIRTGALTEDQIAAMIRAADDGLYEAQRTAGLGDDQSALTHAARQRLGQLLEQLRNLPPVQT